MRTLGLLFIASTTLASCGGESSTLGGPGSSGAGAGSSASAGAGGGGAGATTSGAGAGGSGIGGGGGEGGETAPIVCPEAPLVPGEHQRTLQFGGNNRAYEVQVPLSYDGAAPVPLVFDFHGYTSNKEQQEFVSGFAQKAETEGFLVVRVQGFSSSWNGGDYCCGQAQSQGLDDVGLVKTIAALVADEACVDPRRVYATGISNGGALSHRLACEAADVFAAVAPVAYPIGFEPLAKCQPSRPIAVMHLHGKNDLFAPYDGNANTAPSPASFAHWASVNGCTGSPVETYTKGNSACETYAACEGGVEVALCSINGGHVVYTNLDQVPVADLAWAFLKKHQLPK